MAYDASRDRISGKSSPAEAGFDLTAEMVSDTADLATYGKSVRIYNMSAAAVKIRISPIKAKDDATPMTFTIGPGDKETFPVTCRRIWSSGSTGLVTGLTAGSIECNIYTE